jgi:hypothetical protein
MKAIPFLFVLIVLVGCARDTVFTPEKRASDERLALKSLSQNLKVKL